MKIGMVGLGRMGANIVRRLIQHGHQVVGYNRTTSVAEDLGKETGMIVAVNIEDVVNLLDPKRVIWVMVPSGETTEKMLYSLSEKMSMGDILIDGGNSNFNDTVRRAKFIEEKGIHFIDVGTSGGIWGLSEGYSLMIGGNLSAVEYMKPIFKDLAPDSDKGWGHVGPHGAGHFVKMVHNGIEYGIMEAYAEGFELLRAKSDYNLDLYQISKIWQHGSVVRSWLLDLISAALEEDPDLKEIKGWVADSGEGRWTVFESINYDVPAPVIALSLFRRFYSRQDDGYGAKLLAAMRNQFGGHAMKRTAE